jgi:hypothetical protein
MNAQPRSSCTAVNLRSLSVAIDGYIVMDGHDSEFADTRRRYWMLDAWRSSSGNLETLSLSTGWWSTVSAIQVDRRHPAESGLRTVKSVIDNPCLVL